MPSIAFVTAAHYPQLTADDRLAVLELDKVGLPVTPAIWSDPTIDWANFDLIVLRSMWDYHLHGQAFFQWLHHLERVGANVWNPLPLARWNADKRYLRDLRDRGIEIVPTVWFEQDERPVLREIMEAQGWSEAVVKPVLSSTAYRTFRVRREEADACQPEFHALLHERPAMLQEFQPAIIDEGEWSLIFVAGEPTHSVLKNAVPGDFRVQEEFGGCTRPAVPSAEALELASRAIAAAGSDWLYARVDGVHTTEGFRLMELEMLEPGLFLLEDAAAARRLARAIRELVTRDA
ncbi:MAG: ATP-grasp domain-containing protein [Longimicrobiales bacterium]